MTITCSLDSASLANALAKYNAWYAELQARLEVFVKTLAEKGVEVARVKFSGAQYDGTNDVTVDMTANGTSATVYASGNAVAFIEFGAGTSYNDHPSGMYQHGTYGKGQGSNPRGWVYRGEQGSLGAPVYDRKGVQKPGVWRSIGNPPACAMWDATAEIAASVKEVWEQTMQ